MDAGGSGDVPQSKWPTDKQTLEKSGKHWRYETIIFIGQKLDT